MNEAEANAITDQFRAHYPNQVIDLYAGGQPHYYFVIGLE